uniref:15-cis-phytoene synthase n=1 Tax=Lactuca sativa TaxID=4236 RepID=A0A9R1V4D1_LACSA|nr:hypothetical protein LSAT_V11C700360040 [Lactuca sativa]
MIVTVLDICEDRLEDLFNGRPFDMLDAALTDTVKKFPLDIKFISFIRLSNFFGFQPFRDMIEGMRMDTKKVRYENYQELYLYCYYVDGTVALMTVPVMGISPESSSHASSVYNYALSLGIENQLMNILRDVGEYVEVYSIVYQEHAC